jgi:DNA-binding CsgD family transcriptional regulator
VTLHADLGRLAEIAREAPALASYEREVLAVIGPRVGFDVAMFKRAGGLGPYAPGLDPIVSRACAADWPKFGAEMKPVVEVALARGGGVAVDLDVFGLPRMERLSYYQRLMRPHGGRSTAMVYFTRRGEPIGALALGRTSGSFRARELDYLRALAPTLSLCELVAVSSAPQAPYTGTSASVLTPREREVLGYLRFGYSNAQIACALGSAERTVRNQLSSAYAKLGVATRAEAAALALELGLHRASITVGGTRRPRPSG